MELTTARIEAEKFKVSILNDFDSYCLTFEELESKLETLTNMLIDIGVEQGKEIERKKYLITND